MSYKNTANRVLLGVFLLFVFSTAARYYYRDFLVVELLYTVAEAALIGGLADWFAVTALFEKPLGVKWHTALIPRHRKQFVNGMARVVEAELVSSQLVKDRLRRVNLMQKFIAWASDETGRRLLQTVVTDFLLQVIHNLNTDRLAAALTNMIRAGVAHMPLHQPVRRFGKWALANNRDEQVIHLILDELIELLLRDKTGVTILRGLQKYKRRSARSPLARAALWLGERTDSLNLHDLAKTLQEDLVATLIKLKNPDHAVRRWGRKKMFDYLSKLEYDEELQQALHSWKEDALSRLPLQEAVAHLVQAILQPTALNRQQGLYHSPLLVWGLGQAKSYWEMFQSNAVLQEKVEEELKQMLCQLIDQEHSFIGAVVRDALADYSDEKLSAFVEEKVGDDLAWIRINGSVVGGLVGLVLFLFTHYLYEPYVIILIRNWWSQ